MVAWPHGHLLRRTRRQRRPDHLAGRRPALGADRPGPADRQAAQKAGSATPRRPRDLRRPDLVGPDRQPMEPTAARIRAQEPRPPPVHGVGGDRGAGAGVGDPAARIRRRDRPGLGVASRRRVHRQGPVRQKGGAGEAEATGANPTDRGKPGTKRHLLTEAKGIPVACLVTGANRTDMKKLAELLDAVLVPRPPLEEAHLALDRGYDYDACREAASA